MNIMIKRIYDLVDPSDGKRVLVDRLWPRGISKERAQLDEWMKDVAPSPELRKWFCHDSKLFKEFSVLYAKELAEDPVHQAAVSRLRQYAAAEPLTLIYAAKDPMHNHALVLQQVLLGQNVLEVDKS